MDPNNSVIKRLWCNVLILFTSEAFCFNILSTSDITNSQITHNGPASALSPEKKMMMMNDDDDLVFYVPLNIQISLGRHMGCIK